MATRLAWLCVPNEQGCHRRLSVGITHPSRTLSTWMSSLPSSSSTRAASILNVASPCSQISIILDLHSPDPAPEYQNDMSHESTRTRAFARACSAPTDEHSGRGEGRSGGPGISPKIEKSFFGLIWTDQRLRRVQKAGRSNGSTGLLLCEAAAPNCGAPRRRVLQGGLRRHRRRHRRSCCFCCCRCHRCYQR